MEKEIEKLKQEYLNTQIPKSLEQKGFGDVLSRILLSNEKPHRFYYSQLVGIMILIVLLFTGFVGFAQASKPGTPLYPVKKLTANVLSKVTGKTPEDVEKEINKIMNVPNPTENPTPTPQKIDKRTEFEKNQKGKEIEKTETPENITPALNTEKRTINQEIENVKGIKIDNIKLSPSINQNDQQSERRDD